MPRSPLFRDRLRELRLFSSRNFIAMIVIVLLTAALVARLVYLQVFGYEHYVTLSQQNRVKLVPIPPPRGLIFDRNGVVLAENRPSFRLVVTPEQVKDMNAMLRRLGRIITLRETDLERFRSLLRQSRRFAEVPLKFHLSEKEVATVSVNKQWFPGVDVEASLTRFYPLGPVAAHAIGYVGRINEQELANLDPSEYSGTSHIGKTGAERFYEPILHGQVGVQEEETNAMGRVIRVLKTTPPVPGKNIYLTIDIRLEKAAEVALGDYSGSVVAIEPGTGEILALVSKPTFDPNLFVNGIDLTDYKRLQTDLDQPLFNRAIRGQYPPGSTIKPFVGLAGLEDDVVTPNKRVFCPGYYQLPGNSHHYRGWKHWGHGKVDLHEAIVQSCDVYFYDLAYHLGIDAMSKFLAQFGFGKATGVDLAGELHGILPSRQWKRKAYNKPWYDGETLISGIGQGYNLVTPLQLANATAILADRGRRLIPHLLYAIKVQSGRSGMTMQPPEASDAPVRLKKAAYWSDVIDAMHDVTSTIHGTAHRIGMGATYSIAGKTGTAQVVGIPQGDDESDEDEKNIPLKLRDHALFIAFAPVDEPRIAIAVVVEHGGGGGAVAAPIARKVMDAYFHGGSL